MRFLSKKNSAVIGGFLLQNFADCFLIIFCDILGAGDEEILERNIMLAFVSVVSQYRLQNPINYPDVQGGEYTAIQTNESAIIFVERKTPLSQIFFYCNKCREK